MRVVQVPSSYFYTCIVFYFLDPNLASFLFIVVWLGSSLLLFVVTIDSATNTLDTYVILSICKVDLKDKLPELGLLGQRICACETLITTVINY